MPTSRFPYGVYYILSFFLSFFFVKISYLLDTSGDAGFDALRPRHYFETDVFIFVFKPKVATSFDNIRRKWLPEVETHSPNSKRLLAGFLDSHGTDEKGECASGKKLSLSGEKREPLELAKDIKANAYLEVSPASAESLTALFETCIEEVFLF